MKIKGRTFLEFTNIVKGYNFYNHLNQRVYKFELFYKGENPYKLINDDTYYYKTERNNYE